MSQIKILFSFVFVVFALAVSHGSEWRTYKTSFRKDVNRYPSVLGFFSQMNRIVPVRGDIEINPDCTEVTNNNASILGAVDPSLGQAIESSPGALYFNLYKKCVKTIVESVFKSPSLLEQNQEIILGRDLAKLLKNKAWNQIGLSTMSDDLQIRIIERFIYFLVGPDIVLQASRYIGENNVFKLDEIRTSHDLALLLLNEVKRQNQNLTLEQLYIKAACFLRLGPALQS